MNENALKITPQFILELAIRRRWMILLPVFLALIAGIYLSAVLPRIYEAKTLILIEPQRVPQQYVQSIVTIEPGERINTLSQQILSRTNLEKIITAFGLYEGAERQNLFMEDKVNLLRKQIKIDVISDRRRGSDAFSITLKGKDPKKIASVVNGLASNFIDENLKVRESQALGTSEFLDSELLAMRNRLEQVEESIKDYRKKYMGELPEQLETNLRILDRLQENLNDQQQNLRDGRTRFAELSSQASARQQSVVVIGGQQGAGDGRASLEDLKAELEKLRSRYTEKHPDIVRLRKLIAELEAKQSSDAIDGTSQQAEAPVVSASSELRRQINDARREIQLAEAEIQSLKRQIADYQKRVENTPKREQELLSLKRDYQNIQASYDSLLGRKLEADIAVNMERKQKGEQFRIIDPAKEPQKPIAPNMHKLFLATVAAGIGFGGGVAFLMEFMNASFRKPEELESAVDLPVLASIPTIYRPEQILWRRLEVATSITFSALTMACLAVFAVICINGADPIIKFVR